MRIIYFHQHFTLPQGAAGTRSYKMARQLLNRGHNVTMVCGSYGLGETGLPQPFNRGFRRGIVDGIDIIEFDLSYDNADGYLKRTITFLKYAVKSSILVFTEQYDVIFATTTPLTAGIPGIIASLVLRKPFVFEVRDLWPELPKAMGIIHSPFTYWSMKILEWVSYKSADRLIGLSPGIIEGITRHSIPHNRVLLIPNFCDFDIFDEAVVPWRPESINSKDFLAIFAGTHGVANGLDALLDVSIELLKRGRHDIKILLIGQGKLKPQLQDRVKRDKISNIVFHDPVSKFRLAGLMAASDIGLQILSNVPAFYFGTSPNKFFDYISSGLPVINNYPGWIAEIIEQNNCGYVVSPEDVNSFADALIHAADNRESLHLKSCGAINMAKSKFDGRLLSDKWVDWVTGEFI
jgi:glycosyltransferase involved in cell wall biosynthesis